MKHSIQQLGLVLMSGLVLAGCAVQGGSMAPPVRQGHVEVGQDNVSEMADVQQQIEMRLDPESDLVERQMFWKHLLNTYESRDDRFEISLLTALAMDQLELGQRYAFLKTCQKIRDRIDKQMMIAPETEMVLAVADAMDPNKSAPYNPSRDKGRVTRAVEDLLR